MCVCVAKCNGNIGNIIKNRAMSMRNIRKLYGGNSLPPPDPASDEEYEPLYAKGAASKFSYQGFVLSSHSESEHDSPDAVAEESAAPESLTKKKKKKKKKQRKLKDTPKNNLKDLDEIDKSVMEVNALLGAPPEPAPSASAAAAHDPKLELLAIQAKHLNPANELRKKFGPEEPGAKRRGRQPNLNRILRKAVIVPVTESHNFHKSGLSMSVHRRENGFVYFAFDHNREYQLIHRNFLQLENLRTTNVSIAASIEDARNHMHVEGMLQSTDSLFRFEAYSAANTVIEETIAYMQYVAHPSFNLTDPKVRLEYRIAENRPFHIAVLKYLYLLTNRACHRTALELAKLLLNLDPSDPLAVLFIIDTLALRAREHQWLTDAVEYWSKERDAGFLFNIQYSNAMAHFHVATKNKVDTSKADALLREAMLRFPGVLPRLLQNASITPSAAVQGCDLFNKADDSTGKNLQDLMTLYAKLSWSKWREPGVVEWLTGNANQLAEQLSQDCLNSLALQERARKLANERLNLFRGYPEQVMRHLSIIKPMSNFLVEGAVPRVNRARAWDPVPPTDGLSRYGYDRPQTATVTTTATHSPLYELFSSVLPHYAVPQDFQRRIIEAVANEQAAPQQQVEDNLGPAGDLADLADLVDIADLAEYDTLTDTEDSDNDEAHDENDQGNFVMSVAAVTNAIRQIMNVYETGQLPPDSPSPPPPPPEDPPEPEGGENGEGADTQPEQRPSD